MDCVEEMIMLDYERYRLTLEALEAELAQLPKGNLVYRTSRNRQYCHLQYRDAGGVHNQRVRDAEIEGMQQLLVRRETLQESIKKLRFWISTCEKNFSRLSFFPSPLNTAVFADPEKPYSTLAGIFVRSKSEVIIANELYIKKVPFTYEKPLFLPDSRTPVYPDFTISTPHQHKIIYWEHLGLTDNEDYMAKWHLKERRYAAAGISPHNGNLIITQESHATPFDLAVVVGKITWLQQQ